jgi:hypothetical protein
MIFILVVSSFINASQSYDPKERPTDEPTQATIRIYILDVESINNINQNFSGDFIVRLEWKDERLIGGKSTYPLNQVWHPTVHIFNARDINLQLPEAVTVLPDGTVRYIQRYYGTFASALDFKKFPFDYQLLSLNFVSLLYSENEIEFVFDVGGRADRFSLSGWDVSSGEVSIEPMPIDFDKGAETRMTRASFNYTMTATRHISFYWYKVVAPMAIIVLLSWAVFFIDPSQVAAQVGVSATSILTLIAFLLRLENFIPPISYLTQLDYFVFTTLFLVFMAYMEALVSTRFALRGKKELALKLDYMSRLIFPSVFILIIIFFWVV